MEQQQWEYKVIPIKTEGFLSSYVSPQDLEQLLNDAAKHGYQLVNIIPINTNGFTKEIQVVLKRPVQGT